MVSAAQVEERQDFHGPTLKEKEGGEAVGFARRIAKSPAKKPTAPLAPPPPAHLVVEGGAAGAAPRVGAAGRAAGAQGQAEAGGGGRLGAELGAGGRESFVASCGGGGQREGEGRRVSAARPARGASGAPRAAPPGRLRAAPAAPPAGRGGSGRPRGRGRSLTLEEADAGAAGLPAEGAEGQQQRAVALGQLQVGAALVQQHHGVDQPLAQAGAELLVGDDVLQGQGALGAAADDGAEAHVAGAADVRRVEGEEGAAVEDEALRGALLQQPPQRLALQRAHPQVDHGGCGRGKGEEEEEAGERRKAPEVPGCR